MQSIYKIQIYFYTLGYNEEDIEEMYDQNKEFLALTSQNDNILVMMDFNVLVVETPDQKTVDRYGLGKQKKSVIPNYIF